MKKVLFFLTVLNLGFTAFAQETKPVKSFNVSMVKANWDPYGFHKEYYYIDVQLKNDSFTVRYANTVDTIFRQTTLKKDSAQSFIKKLQSFKITKDYYASVITDKTLQNNSLTITIDKQSQKRSFSTPFTDSIQFNTCVNWLLSYAKQNCSTKSKTIFLDYAISHIDSTQTNGYLADLIYAMPYKSEKPLLDNLNKTNDWNIKHGILKALCAFVTKQSKEAIGTLLNQNIDKPQEDMIVDALMCQFNDDYTKKLLLQAMYSKDRNLREKIMRFLAIQSVKEVKPEVLAYIHQTFAENNASIKPNSYFEITNRIADKELITDLISLYQKNKSPYTSNSNVLKELMHAIECNIECYRNIHNEYTFPEFIFNYDIATKRLDAKIEMYLKK